ncbi:MFS superfamily sulfate permease-like transporter [Rhodobacter sp. JA431]|uniref:SulP family inorganic anion transporter n=1 Tax=Rhodobacter sp. JA431 TaxID=570013 RepID=UPI000BC85B43|nr:SulP family inorganic anion transporter [Rhodobacter sp. JA431]SOC00271.1 MFS superfamily sulfate permease-like transporter [Rhodobacter sp. JA431]
MSMRLFVSLRGASLRHDLIAALTLAALALPEQLATARLAGLPAAQGIAVFAVASLVMVLVSRNKVLSVGADSSISPIIASALIAATVPGAAPLIAALVGVILCIVALLRLEGIARLLSLPVATGMMAGIALHILVGRLPIALGIEIPARSPVATLEALWQASDAIRFEPLALTVLVTGLCVLGRAWSARFPAALVALAAAVAIAAFADPDATLWPRVETFGGSWGLTPLTVSPDAILSLLPVALVIAFLCLFQTTAVLREGRADQPKDRRNALGALGLSNLAAAAIGGFAVNASPPRTAILRDAGATSQFAGVIAALVALAVMVLAPDLLQRVPAAALAGILVFVALHIFPLRSFVTLLRHSRIEAGIALTTTALVTVLPLQSGLPLAILLSFLHATLPLFATQVVRLSQVPGTTIWWHRPEADAAGRVPALLVLGITAPMNFVTAEGIVAEIRAFLACAPKPPSRLVLECAGLLSLDLTGAGALIALIEECHRNGTAVALARVESDRAYAQLAQGGVLEVLGKDRVFDSVAEAVHALGPPAIL